MRGEFERHPTDTGSTEVQVAALTERISHLNGHFKVHRHDFSSARGLQRCLAQRRKLLRYLRRKDFALYGKTIESLGLKVDDWPEWPATPRPISASCSSPV